MAGIAYVDGTITSLAEAKVPLMDRGYLLGDGVFETLHVSGGRPFRLDDHASRMQRGLEILNMDPVCISSFHDAVDALLDASDPGSEDDLYMRINITSGRMVSIPDGDGISVTGVCKPFAPYSSDHYTRGVSMVIAPQRKDTQDPLSTIKHLSFLGYVAARRHARTKGAHDAVLLNTEGRVAEASTANLFALVDGVLHAPGGDEGALPGVTRMAMLDLADDAGMDMVEQLEIEDLRRATEAFATNTRGGVVPVTRFEGSPIGDGVPGKTTKHMAEGLDAMIRGEEN